jgi:pilus assembly protein Flp/PilA
VTPTSWGSPGRETGPATRLEALAAALFATLRTPGADRGVTAIEYALVASLIAMAIIGAVITLGGSVTDLFDTVSSNF